MEDNKTECLRDLQSAKRVMIRMRKNADEVYAAKLRDIQQEYGKDDFLEALNVVIEDELKG